MTSFVPSTTTKSSRNDGPRKAPMLQRAADDPSSFMENNANNDHLPIDSTSRRGFFQVTAGSTMASLLASNAPAHARGLVGFPCTTPLLNAYHLMKAGTSLLEEEDVWSTNPLFLDESQSRLIGNGSRTSSIRLQNDARSGYQSICH